MVTSPSFQAFRAPLPFAHWPEDDRQTWQAGMMPTGPFGYGGTAARWAPATKSKYLGSYGRWLAFLEAQGRLDRNAPFASRAQPGWIADYVDALQQRVSPLSVWSYISDLHNIHYRLAPSCDWSWLRQIVNRLQLTAGHARRSTSRLRPIDEIFDAGIAEMDRAGSLDPYSRLHDSVYYRDGLMVALLAATLLRVKNFAALELGRQLVRQPEGYLLAVAAAEVKNKQDIEQPIIGRLTPYLDRYFESHHLRLLNGSAAAHLWVNRYAAVMKPYAVGKRIAEVTSRLLGVAISPHLFRHCAATTVAMDDPEHAMMIRSLLAHSRIATAERYYNRASIAEAGRRHATTITQLRNILVSTDLKAD